MSLTIGITSHNYGEYLPRAIESALRYGDQVIVVDNASDDGSQGIIADYEHVHGVLHKLDRGIVASLNEILRLAKCDRVMMLDADDWLIGDPHQLDGADWCFASTYIERDGAIVGLRDLSWMATNYIEAVAKARVIRSIPVSMKGTFSMDWIRRHKLVYQDWPNVRYGEDTLTCLEWMKTEPTVRFCTTPVYVYRDHPIDDGPRRRAFEGDFGDYLDSLA